jgi:hypothetical protein
MADTIVIDTTETETVEVVTTGPQGPPGTGEGGDGTFATDIETTTTGNGLIMKSPNGNRWRLTPSNTGLAVFTALSLLMLASLAPAQVVGIGRSGTNIITDTNATLAWSNALAWTTNTASGATRTNLGLTNSWLTNRTAPAASAFAADFYDDFSAYSDGTLLTNGFRPIAGSNYSLIYYAASNATPGAPIVTNGRLRPSGTNNPPDGNETYYLTSVLPNNVRSFGADVQWVTNPSTDFSAFVFLIRTNNDFLGAFLHITVSFTSANLQWSTNGAGALTTVTSGTYTNLERGKPVRILGNINSNVLTLNVGGNIIRGTNEYFATLAGRWFTFEQYGYGLYGITDIVEPERVWANASWQDVQYNGTNWSVQDPANLRTSLGLGAWLTNSDSPIFLRSYVSTGVSGDIGDIGTNVFFSNSIPASRVWFTNSVILGGPLGNPVAIPEKADLTVYGSIVGKPHSIGGGETQPSISVQSGGSDFITMSPSRIAFGGAAAATTLTNLFTNSNGIPAFGATSNSTYTVVGGQGAWVAPRSVTKVRTNDFVRTNSSITYSNDDTLAGWTLDASSLYSVTIWIPYTCSTNSAFKGQITVPAMERADQNFGSIVVESGGQVFSIGSSNTIIPLAARTTASAAKNWVGRLFFRTGTNSGTANFQWAPAAGGSGTNTNTTTLHSGATITFTKISD